MSAHDAITHRVTRAVRQVSPAAFAERSAARKIVQQFAEQAGLIYFGTINPRDDDYHPIRGYTMSTTHRDRHYSVGNIRGYNVTLVSRRDMVRIANNPKLSPQQWLIAAVDMYTRRDVPYMFIGRQGKIASYPSYKLQPLRLGMFGPQPDEFMQKYTVYGELGRAVEIERYLTPDVASVIVSHFDDLSIEISSSVLYIYAAMATPTMELLDRMVSDGLWLAATFDVFAEQLAAAQAERHTTIHQGYRHR